MIPPIRLVVECTDHPSGIAALCIEEWQVEGLQLPDGNVQQGGPDVMEGHDLKYAPPCAERGPVEGGRECETL